MFAGETREALAWLQSEGVEAMGGCGMGATYLF